MKPVCSLESRSWNPLLLTRGCRDEEVADLISIELSLFELNPKHVMRFCLLFALHGPQTALHGKYGLATTSCYACLTSFFSERALEGTTVRGTIHLYLEGKELGPLNEPNLRTESHFLSRETWADLRSKRDLHKPLLTAVAQALPFLTFKAKQIILERFLG